MPINKDLKPVTLPMVLKFDKEPQTEFINNLDALEVDLIDAPTRESAQKVAWAYTKSTWADDPSETDISSAGGDSKELSENLKDVLSFRALPTPMECLGFTFRISGISLQTVTHLIRHRAGSFAAQCTGDRDLRYDNVVVPESIENSSEFYERYQKIVNDSVQLYSDMTDSKQISMMDARVILPKCMSTFYMARFNLKDLIGVVRQRQDVQIQPEVDNIIAMKMAIAACSAVPEIAVAFDFNRPDMHYVKTFRVKTSDGFTSRGTNLYQPETKNDIFEYHPDDTIYPCRREDLKGTDSHDHEKRFTKLWKQLNNEFAQIKNGVL